MVILLIELCNPTDLRDVYVNVTFGSRRDQLTAVTRYAEKWSPEKWSLRKMIPEKNDPQKNGPRKIVPRTNGPRKNGARKIGLGWAQNSEIQNSGSNITNENEKSYLSSGSLITNPSSKFRNSRCWISATIWQTKMQKVPWLRWNLRIHTERILWQFLPHYRLPYCFVICAIYCCEFHHAVWWKSPYGYGKLCNIKTHKIN